MIYHILNGDSLAYSFPDTKIEGEIIVAKEALIAGDLSGDNLTAFWRARSKYIGMPYDEYYKVVVSEFEKIMTAPDNSEFNLWFEYDLFCQVNMWFVLSLIDGLPMRKKVFAVYTFWLHKNDKHFWNGFGPAKTNELKISFDERIQFSSEDIRLGRDLWIAYKNGDINQLKYLSLNRSVSFPYLPEVIEAHIDRFPRGGKKGRPERVLEDITKNISTDFHTVFKEFWNRESIYGFGDIQLKQLYDKVMETK